MSEFRYNSSLLEGLKKSWSGAWEQVNSCCLLFRDSQVLAWNCNKGLIYWARLIYLFILESLINCYYSFSTDFEKFWSLEETPLQLTQHEHSQNREPCYNGSVQSEWSAEGPCEAQWWPWRRGHTDTATDEPVEKHQHNQQWHPAASTEYDRHYQVSVRSRAWRPTVLCIFVVDCLVP